MNWYAAGFVALGGLYFAWAAHLWLKLRRTEPPANPVVVWLFLLREIAFAGVLVAVPFQIAGMRYGSALVTGFGWALLVLTGVSFLGSTGKWVGEAVRRRLRRAD